MDKHNHDHENDHQGEYNHPLKDDIHERNEQKHEAHGHEPGTGEHGHQHGTIDPSIAATELSFD